MVLENLKNLNFIYDKDGSGKASVYNRKLDHFNINFNKNEIIKVNTIDNYCIENKNKIQ